MSGAVRRTGRRRAERALVSRKWSGRNLTEHRTERRDHVLRTLGVVEQSTPDGERERYTWEPIRPTDPTNPCRG